MKKNEILLENYRRWVVWLALVGIGLASYLYYEYLTQNAIGVCDINSVFNCKPIIIGSLSTLFSVPVSLIGLVGYVIILLTAFFKKLKWAFYMSVFGMLFCLRITILEIFVEGVLCPVCLACQTVMLIEFVLTMQLAFPKKFGLSAKSEVNQ